MRKLTLGTLLFTVLFAGCKKTDTPFTDAAQPDPIESTQAITKRNCGSYEVLQRQMAEDPSFRQKLQDIEVFTRKAIENGAQFRLVNGVIEIPVVVHVLWNAAKEDISNAQIQSQIDVLNEDYQNLNSDRIQSSNAFYSVASQGMAVKFVLDGIPIHKYTKVKSWSTNDAVKNSKRGGDDAVSPTTKLNMWACNLGQGLLGYAQFPGGNPATDGVVILYSAFGSRAKCPTGTYINTYDLGRTATHEVGHWMNLRHIWGDATCGSDQVNDTPPHKTSNYGCPDPIPVTCSSTSTTNPYGFTNEMTMNYMDYTDDACMYMFSNGQKSRAMSVFATGGARAAIGQP